jgi:CRISPR-associated protein Csm4
MSAWKLVRLNFGSSPAHFGEVGIGIEETSERVRSDTLFSAWVSSYARLFDVEELLNQFPRPQQMSSQKPPFRLSSTFIYRRNGERYIYYLPKPLEFPEGYPEDDLKFTKTYKKLNYLPLEVWQRWYQGDGFTLEGDKRDLIAETEKKADGTESLHKAGTFDYGKAYKIHQTPKVAIDRTTRATNFYHTGFVQFEWEQSKQSGLYFLLNFPEQDRKLEDKLHAALKLLGEEGLGGERSSGAGRFEVEWEEFPQDWQDVVDFAKPTHYALMSLFWELPLPKELLDAEGMLDKTASYAIQERGGWIASPSSGRQLRRKMVRMFAEGSVFPIAPSGKLADVTPDKFKQHKIYRSGISLSLPVTLPSR